MFKRLILGILLFGGTSVTAQTITPGGPRAQQHRGVASMYASSLSGRRTASGERYNHSALTAAHRTLPFGTKLRVENTHNGRTVCVRVNDRGPFVGGRVLDLSGEAMRRLRGTHRGLIRTVYYIDPTC